MARKIITIITIATIICTSVVGCTSSTSENETTTKATPKETTTEEPTMEEVTTEELTTLPGEFLMTFYVWEEEFEYFDGLVVEKGYVFKLNDIVPEKDRGVDRGEYASIITRLGDNSIGDEFDLQDRYLKVGQSKISIPYEDNLTIEYMGEKKLKFCFTKDMGDGQVEFYVYLVK